MSTNQKRFIIWGLAGAFGVFLLLRALMGHMEGPFTAEGLGTWLAAFLSICILSFLYDDNPLYKFAEHLFIGISAAYYMVYGVWDELIKHLLIKVWPGLASNLVDGVQPVDTLTRLIYIVPFILGLLLLWRLSPKGGWIARWPLAFIVGWAAGTNLVRYLVSDFIGQIQPTFVPLIVVQDGSFMLVPTLLAIVTVFGLLTALIYFFFSVEHKGAFGVTSKIGIWILMITFGAAFGYTVMGRIALLVGRMEFLFVDWLEVISP